MSAKLRFHLLIIGTLMAIALTAFIVADSPHSLTNVALAKALAIPGVTADRVLGQVNFTTNNQDVLNSPSGVAIDSNGRLFAVEYGNHRVSSWPDASSFISGEAPDLIIGGYGESGANAFNGPISAVVDGAENLWVADTFNNRVLRFPPPYTGGADLVLGQADFSTNAINRGGSPAADGFYFPRGIAFDINGYLYVADLYNNRVLQFEPPFDNGEAAVGVFGQPSFFDNTSRTSSDGLYVPTGVVASPDGHIFIADRNNNRVLRWMPGASDADLVLGQPTFTSSPAFYSGDLPPNYDTYAECVPNPFNTPPTMPSPAADRLSHPLDMVIDPGGNLYVSDTCWQRVVVYFSSNFADRAADLVYGQPDLTSGSLEAPSKTTFNTPLGLAFYNASLFVADFANHRILAFDPGESPTSTSTPTATSTPTNTPLPGSTPTNTPTSTPTGPPPPGDPFEEDDACAVARVIPITGAKQSRTFHDVGDVDWLKFTAQAGKTYIIQVENKGANSDAIIALFDVCDQPPNSQTNNSFGSTVTLEWDSTRNGDYYIRLQQFDPTLFGATANYEVSVILDQIPPSAPKKLRCVSVNSTTLGLQWDPSPERDVAAYRVTYTGNISGAEDVSGKDTTFYQVSGLTTGQAYNLRVRALDFSGNESAPSGEVPCIASQPADTTLPAFNLQQPGASTVFTTSASQLTFVGAATDAGNNLSRARVHNATLNKEGWDYTLSGASDDFRIEDMALALGDNNMAVEVTDGAGNTTKKTITVRRLGNSPGAVIIVAGQNETAALQTNIFNAANRVYRIALSAGYNRDTIYYLAPTGQDANGDGVSDVNASPATADKLQYAIVNWSQMGNKVGKDKPLFIYMIDHGFEEKFCLTGCNSGFVAPTAVDGWLTSLENATSVDQVNIVIEACRSGSFIDRINDVASSLSKPGRVVITSTSREKNAYASAQGAYFSDAFFSCIADSNNLKACFDQASQSVKTVGASQSPMLDDNGDGVFNSGDGTQAQSRYLTRFFSSIRPEIISASVERQGANGVLSATVAEGAEKIDIVWAAIFPPSFQEPSDVTINLNAPTVKLEPDPNTPGRYAFNYLNGFTEEGDYRIIFYAQDRLGIQALPKTPGEGMGVYLPLITK
jgi:sugar lactone lactonase YvrE